MLTRTHVVLIMSYASGGALFQYVQKSGFLSEDVSRYFFRQLIAAVETMHASGLFHRDLKLENALVHIDERRGVQLQLCDFGSSKHELLDSSLKSGAPPVLL